MEAIVKRTLFLVIVVVCYSLSAQAQSVVWSVPSFVQPCEDSNQLRYIYPGPITFNTDSSITWLYRNRSSCANPSNNFTSFSVSPSGSPLLASLFQYTTPSGYSYYESMSSYGDYVYWMGNSYSLDTGRSILIVAYKRASHDSLWMVRWRPDPLATYTGSNITATADGIYITANATTYQYDPYIYTYSMVLAKFDTSGREVWRTMYTQPFSQSFKTNIVVTDSLVYVGGSRYNEFIPYDKGSGFVGAYSVSSGAMIDSFYFTKKRPLSEYIPSLITAKDSAVMVCGANTAAADLSTFVSRFSPKLDSQAFIVLPTTSYSPSIYGATFDDNGFLYTLRSDYSYSSRIFIDAWNCNGRGCTFSGTNRLLDSGYSSFGDFKYHNGAIYLTVLSYSYDTTLPTAWRYDAYLKKFDAAPLAVQPMPAMVSEEPLRVYPNPVHSSAVINSDRMFFNATLTIEDVTGREVRRYEHLSGNRFLFEINLLPDGFYNAILTEAGGFSLSTKLLVRD